MAWRVCVNGQGERTVEATEGMFEILEVRTPQHVEKKNGLRYIFNSAVAQLKKLHGDNWWKYRQVQQETEVEELMRVSPNRRQHLHPCLLYTSPSPRDGLLSRMPSSA